MDKLSGFDPDHLGSNPSLAANSDVYVGERCLTGECALCNPNHPKHAEAQAEIDRLFGVTRDVQ